MDYTAEYHNENSFGESLASILGAIIIILIFIYVIVPLYIDGKEAIENWVRKGKKGG